MEVSEGRLPFNQVSGSPNAVGEGAISTVKTKEKTMKRLTLVIAALALLAIGAASPVSAEEREAYQWQGRQSYVDNMWGIWSLTWEPSSNPQIFWGNWYRGETGSKTYNYGTMEGLVDRIEGMTVYAHGTWAGEYEDEGGTWEGWFMYPDLSRPCEVVVTKTSPSPSLTETYDAVLCAKWPSDYSYYTTSYSISDAYGCYPDQAMDAGGLHISHVCRRSHSVYYSYMTWDGVFSDPELVAYNVVADLGADLWGRYTSIDYDPLGYPHISYTDDNTAKPMHAWKDQYGWHTEQMWSGHTPISISNHYTTIDIDQNTGILHACGDLNGQLWYGTRSPSGVWSAVTVQATNVGSHCDIAVDANGIPHIIYQETNNFPYLKLKYATKINGLWVTTYVNDLIYSCQAPTVCPSIAIDASGKPHVAYHVGATALKYAYLNGGLWNNEVANSIVGKYSSTAITFDKEGHPIILYYGGEYPYAGPRMNRRIGTGLWEFEVVDVEAIQDAMGIAVGIKESGNMICSYWDAREYPVPPQVVPMGKLKVAERALWTGSGSQSPVALEEEDAPIEIQPAIVAISTSSSVGSVDIHYQVPEAGKVSITVFDVTGRQVKALYSGQQTSGSHQLTWDGVDDAGRNVSSGVYIVRMKAGDFQAREKVTIIR